MKRPVTNSLRRGAANSPRSATANFRRRAAAFLTYVTCALLAACATPPAGGPAAPLAPRAAVDRFESTGRVAARVTTDTSRGFAGGYTWAHEPGTDRIELLAPTGQTVARMHVSAGGATIETADGRTTQAPSAEQFLTEAMGVTLPIAALPYWMQAVPLPGERYRAEADALGRPSTLWQSGWEIRYETWTDDTAAARPARMQLAWGDVQVRLVVSEWSAK